MSSGMKINDHRDMSLFPCDPYATTEKSSIPLLQVCTIAHQHSCLVTCSAWGSLRKKKKTTVMATDIPSNICSTSHKIVSAVGEQCFDDARGTPALGRAWSTVSQPETLSDGFDQHIWREMAYTKKAWLHMTPTHNNKMASSLEAIHYNIVSRNTAEHVQFR